MVKTCRLVQLCENFSGIDSGPVMETTLILLCQSLSVIKSKVNLSILMGNNVMILAIRIAFGNPNKVSL